MKVWAGRGRIWGWHSSPGHRSKPAALPGPGKVKGMGPCGGGLCGDSRPPPTAEGPHSLKWPAGSTSKHRTPGPHSPPSFPSLAKPDKPKQTDTEDKGARMMRRG
ncbi:hypothetical protein VULLAG_LOCUS12300 [Vulpes lagopus]